MRSGRKTDRQVLDALNSVLEGSQDHPDARYVTTRWSTNPRVHGVEVRSSHYSDGDG